MVNHVVVTERLLQHHEAKLVESAEMVRVSQGIGRIRVRHKPDLREPLSDGSDNVHVPARLDLDLDALVSRLQLCRNQVEQFVHCVLDSDRHAARDGTPHSPDVPPEGPAERARLQFPARCF